MGKAYWLNWRTGQAAIVPDTHEQWLADREQARTIGLSNWYLDQIAALDHHNANHVDTIRIIGMHGGLVRIRQYDGHRQEISVQFIADSGYTRKVLWGIFEFLRSSGLSQTLPIRIQNLRHWADDVTVLDGLSDFRSRLEKDQPILRESECSADVKPDDSLLARLDAALNNYP